MLIFNTHFQVFFFKFKKFKKFEINDSHSRKSQMQCVLTNNE
jgi:hypothetical protein